MGNFGTLAQRDEFIRALQARPSNEWSTPLPNLKWLSEKEFSQHGFFGYSYPHTLWVSLGGPNKNDNHAQLPPDFPKDLRHVTHYPRVFMSDNMTGVLILASHHAGRVWFASFAFCEHKRQTRRNIGRCFNEYTCQDCGYTESIDSSD